MKKIWTRDSSILLGGSFVTIILIIYVWWPLAAEYFAFVDWNGDWWRCIDWFWIGIFALMSFTIIASASKTTREKMSYMAAKKLIVGSKRERLPNCVNPQVYVKYDLASKSHLFHLK